MVQHVRNIDVALLVHFDVRGHIQHGGDGGSAIAGETGCASARNRDDHAIRCHLPDAMIQFVGDIEIARGVERDAGHTAAEIGIHRPAAVSSKTGNPGSRDCHQDSVGQFGDAGAVELGEVNHTVGIDRQGAGPIERRHGGRRAWSVQIMDSAPDDSGDLARRADLPDSIILLVGDNDVPVRRDGEITRIIKARAKGRSAVADTARASRIFTKGRSSNRGFRSAAGYGRDNSLGVDLADPLVGGIGEIDVSGIDVKMDRLLEIGLSRIARVVKVGQGQKSAGGRTIVAKVSARRNAAGRRAASQGSDHPCLPWRRI